MFIFLRWLVNLIQFIWLLWLWLCFFICLSLFILTLLFSQLPHYRATVEYGLNAFLTQSLSLGALATDWRAGQPQLTLSRVRLGDTFDLAEAEITLDLWGSLTQAQLLTQNIHLKFQTLQLPTAAQTEQLNFTERILFNWLLQQPQITIELDQLTGLTAELSDFRVQKTITQIQAQARFSLSSLHVHKVIFNGHYQPTAVNPLTGQLTLEQLQVFKTADSKQPLMAIPQLDAQLHLTAAGHIEISQLLLKQHHFQQTVPITVHLQTAQSALSLSAQFETLSLAKSHIWFTDPQLRAWLKATQGQLQQCQGHYQAPHWQIDCQLTALALQPHTEIPLGINALSAQLHLESKRGRLTIPAQAVKLHIPQWYPTPIAFKQVAGQLDWHRDTQGHWHVTTPELTLTDHHNTSMSLNGQFTYPNIKMDIALNGSLTHLRQYVPASYRPQGWSDVQISGQLATARLNLQGTLNDIQLVNAAAELKHTQIHYQVDNATQMAVDIGSGQLQLQPEQGVLQFKQAQARLTASQFYTQPLTMTQLQGSLRWHRQAQQWRLSTDDLQAHSHRLPIQVRGHIDIPRGPGEPRSDLTLELGQIPLKHISRYFPDKRLTPLVNWFDHALTQGSMQRGTLHLQGPIDQLLENLTAEIEVNQARIHYAQHWPPLTQVNAQIAIKQNQLTVTALQGQLLTQQIQKIQVDIPQLVTQPTQLKLKGQLIGPAQDGLRFIAQSPLHKTIALSEQRFSLDGNMQLGLQLTLPLGQSKQTTQLQGQIDFEQTTLKDNILDINIAAINGRLTFTEDNVTAEQLRGQWLNTPIECSILTLKAPKRTQVRLRGPAHQQFLTQLVDHYLVNASGLVNVSGQTHWSALLEWPHEHTAAPQFSLATDLTGLAIHLPPPLQKTASQSRPLRIQAQLSAQQPYQLKLHYGQIANGILEINSKGLVRGGVIFGTQAAQLPAEQQLTVGGQMAQFSLTQWLDKATSKVATTPALPLLLDVHFQQLELLGQFFTNVAIQARYQEQNGQIAVTGDHIEGQIRLESKPRRVQLAFNQLALAPSPQSSTTTTLDPRQLPGLSFYCRSLQLGEITLDEVNLKTYAQPNGLKLALSSTTPEDLELNLEGQWRYQAQHHQTHMQLQLSSLDIQQLFQKLGYQQPPIVGTFGRISADVSWQNAPYRFEKHTLAGNLSLLMLDGHLVDIEPGAAGRVFGLFDIPTLSRRLSLDFSDVLDQGLGFASLSGFFNLDKGQAYTDDLTLQAPAAHIKFRGKTNLVTQEYDQQVTVIPHVSNTLPVAGVLAGGLGIGAAALLIQQLVRSEIEQAIHYRYQVRGPWSQPEVISLSHHNATSR
ncbi:MAG: DUF3971 domain-containing protein [Pseudomonadota bacterium]|nr:DUF3971 domain-containing protein [Pseudomonadota bacterium]